MLWRAVRSARETIERDHNMDTTTPETPAVPPAPWIDPNASQAPATTNTEGNTPNTDIAEGTPGPASGVGAGSTGIQGTNDDGVNSKPNEVATSDTAGSISLNSGATSGAQTDAPPPGSDGVGQVVTGTTIIAPAVPSQADDTIRGLPPTDTTTPPASTTPPATTNAVAGSGSTQQPVEGDTGTDNAPVVSPPPSTEGPDVAVNAAGEPVGQHEVHGLLNEGLQYIESLEGDAKAALSDLFTRIRNLF